ncbi:hypothetical protein CNMCM5793_000491 [Aspergillus hiratsukae]|uniref:DUF7703 domain-containing protein n=1 Tax=Aspergillus hiratsukae TaxID=1194566 RepID=A0A8H6UJR5_9EURO|nr:hypothetical protein CNMCM5793_000491 [Aspergillus hiratsukae]KAF7156942.1 hypothetical protein CNMCM6106_001721 [Aspergillus hiratsukae]
MAMMALRSTMGFGLSRRASTSYSSDSVLVIVCSTLALYNAFELLVLIITTFKRRKGLYFWSILLASFGVIPYSAGWTLVHFSPTIAYAGMTIASIGWVLLISGQSVVLYSRLHLVLDNAKILRAVLWMIICNAVIWHPSITVLYFCSTYSPRQSRSGFIAVFSVMEKVQMTFFCIQEFIISGLYIWATLDILRMASGNKRLFMWKLFSINVLIVFMDVALLAVEYKNYFTWEQGLKVVMYSIKLKLEFAVLSELVKFVRRCGDTNPMSTSHYHMSGSLTSSGDSPHTKDKKAQSASMPEAIHMEALQIDAVVSENHRIRVTTTTHTGDFDPGDYRSANQLYNDAVRQISRLP